MSIRCIIVDDEELGAKVIESHLGHVSNFELVGTYHNAVEAYLALDELEVDVLFLDVHMPKLKGTTMLEMLKKRPITVLTTAHRDYAVEGYELEVTDYLLKPISLERFLQSIKKIEQALKAQTLRVEMNDPNSTKPMSSPHSEVSDLPPLYVRADRSFVKVDMERVFYVESIKNHIRIVTEGENIISLMSLSEFEQKTEIYNFLRVHRSYMVNVDRIQKFNGQEILCNEKKIPIGRSYKDEVMRYLSSALNF